jgi:pimeloyl-ACP methyl ester carboxylesterase
MDRRMVLAGGAALALSGCATGSVGQEPEAPFDGDRIMVWTSGQGRDLVLIPGLSSHPEIWDDLVERLGAGYRVHRVHVRGFAGLDASDNASGPVAAPVAEAIADYLGFSGIASAAVIGHSMGGTIALMLAARHPALVERLMVVDQVPFMGLFYGPPGTTAESVRPVADMTRDRMASADDAAWAAGAQAAIGGMVLTESGRAGPIRHAVDTDRRVAAEAMHELITTDLTGELGRITAPTTVLYVNGPNIPLTDAQLDAVYQAAYAPLSGVALKRIPDSGHFIMIDQPDVFEAEVRAFLD